MTRIRSHNWSEAEERVLIDEWIRRKDIMKDPSNTAATKEARNQAWKDIQLALQEKCLSATRNVDQLQKKWNNLKDKAKKEYSMERKSMNGGPEYKMSPLMEHLYLSVWGDASAILPTNEITIKESPVIERQPFPSVKNAVSIPMTIFDSISELSRVNEEISEHLSQADSGDISEEETNPVLQRLQLQMLHAEQMQSNSGASISATGSSPTTPVPPTTQRKTATKRALDEITEESCRLQLLKERLNIAYITMQCRKELGEPVTFSNMDDVFPPDIASFLKRPNKF